MPHLQLKDLPQGVHDELRRRSALAGVSMREYVVRLLEADLGRPATWPETLAELAELPRAQPGESTGAEVLAEARQERLRELTRRSPG